MRDLATTPKEQTVAEVAEQLAHAFNSLQQIQAIAAQGAGTFNEDSDLVAKLAAIHEAARKAETVMLLYGASELNAEMEALLQRA